MNDLSTLPQMDGMMQTLERLARDPQIPTERITELFRLAEKREMSMMRRIYFTDMNAMQMELTQITRDRHNPAFHSKYALSLIHISEPTRLLSISYAVFCL